jgi:hypothetical protein
LADYVQVKEIFCRHFYEDSPRNLI